MRDFINRPGFIRSLEFWTATSIFFVVLFFRISGTFSDELATASGLETGRYYRLVFFPQILQNLAFYLAFLVLNFLILPKVLRRQSMVFGILSGVLVMGALGLALSVLDTYLRSGSLRAYPSLEQAYVAIFRERGLYMIWLSIAYCAYAAGIRACMYLMGNLGRLQQRYPVLSAGPVLATAMWLISLFFLTVVMRAPEVSAFWAIFPPSSILVYLCGAGYLIPKAVRKRKPFRNYLLKSFLWLFAAFFPAGIIASVICSRPDIGFPAAMLNSIFQFLVATPVTWVLYSRNRKREEELRTLREKLGQSKANLDFLRSQINPHFLFNALNTIYGTALEEGAERTGEGVHRLGDMMRFMLQENTQELIPLSRETEYLHNYIALQRLRTDAHPGIEIRTEIAEDTGMALIAPMLLIPFVENAFKHGISLRRPSYVRIALELREGRLNFDIHNSRHPRQDGDPEQHSHGIGLSNVRQRLELLYPGAHELMIRETGREYFVHLSIQIDERSAAPRPAAELYTVAT